MGNREPSCTVGGNVNWYNYYGEQYASPFKTTMRYHLKSVRMAIMKIQEISVGEDMEKREPLCTVDGNVN